MADYVVTATLQDGISDPANAAAAAMDKASDSADSLTAAVTRVGPSAATLMRRYDDTTASALALQKAQTLLAQATDTMNIAVAEGAATDAQRSAVLGTLQTKVAALRDATAATLPPTAALSAAHGTASTAATGAAMAHAGFTRELVILGHEVVVGNYSRIPGSMMVLAERTGNLNGIISTLGSLVFGWPGLFAAGAAALGVLAYSANSTEERLLSMQTALRATRDDYMSMAAEALAAAKAVGSIPGFSSADTRTAAQTTAGAPDFTGTSTQLQTLLRVEGDLATVMGTTLPEAAKTLATAMQDPGAEADKLAKEHFPGMTAALADAIKAQQTAGDTAGAFGQVLSVIKDQVTGAATASKTELQTALENLGRAFTNTGADGVSMGKSIGDAVKDAVADTINGLAAIVAAINSTRNTLSAHSKPGGPAGTFNPNAAPGPTGSPLLGPPTAGGEQAVGLFQVMPSTAAGLGYSATDLATTGGNIQAEIAVLLQKYFQSGGNIDQTLALYGGYGNDTNAASGYISSVKNANPAAMDPAVLAAIQQEESRLNLPSNLRTIAERLPVVESSGRQFGAATSASAAGASAFTADVNTGPQSAGTGVTNLPQQQIDAALALADKAGTVAGSSTSAAAQIQAYTTALHDLAAQGDTSSLSVSKLSEALEKAQLEYANAIPAVQKITDATNLQVAGENAVAVAWASGAGAAQDATDKVKAETQARTLAAPGTAAYTAAVVALTDAYISLTAAQQQVSAAQQINGQGQQLDYLKAETSTLGESADTRARELATMKEQQTIENSLSHATDAQKQTLLDQAAAIADATSELQRQQAAWNEVANVAGQVADQIGSSISNAFINGNGAAINFGNIARAALASVVTKALELAIINPLMNAAFGTSSTTLSSVLSAFASAGGSGSSLLGEIGTGGTGALSSITSFLNSPLFGGATPTNSAIDSLGAGQFGPATPAAVASAGASTFGGTATVGGAVAGVGGGFALGSFAGSVLGGNSQNGEIGAAAGAIAGAIVGSIVPGIGTIIGGLVGGLLGGTLGGSLGPQGKPTAIQRYESYALDPLATVLGKPVNSSQAVLSLLIAPGMGGLIGPGPANAFSSTAIDLQKNGSLSTGVSYAQGGDASTLDSTNSDTNTINTALTTMGLILTSLGGITQIGQNTPGGFQDPSKASSLAAAFPKFRFASTTDSELNTDISGKSFATLTDLENAVTLVTQTIPPLLALAHQTGSLSDAITSLNSQFQPAITAAAALGLSTADLTAAQAVAVQAANDAAAAQVTNIDEGLQSNYLSAAATISGNPADALTAQLYTFDAGATQQESALKAQLTGIYGDSYTSTAAYATQMADLESSLGEQRLAIQQQYNDKLAATATSAITSLTAEADKLQSSSASPLSPQAQYTLASSQFSTAATAAAGGDFTSLTNLPTLADTFLADSRTVNGSGAQYATDFQTAINALAQVANTSPDVLTASVLQSEVRTQTQQLQDSLADLKTAVNQVNATLQQGAATPARITT